MKQSTPGPTATPLDIDALFLGHGAHPSPDAGMCVLEAVAYLSGEPFSDHPECVCPTIASFLRSWNDSLKDEPRQRLKRFVPLVVGTNLGSDVALRRSYMVADWFVRIHTAAWLELAGLSENAAELRALPEIVDKASVHAGDDAIGRANKAVDAAWAAAGDAAWAAARAAARDAARDAAGDAAWAAAWGKLAPTSLALMASAEELVERMIAHKGEVVQGA